MTGRRRIDRILADDYLEGLSELPTDELRRMRDACEEEESGISYARRVLQGHLDILRAEALRRRDEGSAEATSLLERLPGILGDEGHTSAPTKVRPTRFLVPPSVKHHRRSVDAIVDEDVLADVRSKPADELAQLVEALTRKESELSAVRRQLFERIDRLQDELVERYRSGAADVGDVLSPSG